MQFPSHSALEEFETIRFNFFEKLKMNLNNYYFDYSHEIIESKNAFIMTPKAVFEKLKESNPLLDKLNNFFHLDI